MARKAREKSSTGIYHILLRANNKLFLNDADTEYFNSLAGQHFRDGVSIYGFRTEDERVHIVLKENSKTISDALKSFCTSYARYFNRVHNIDGKLFDGRFKSEPIENDERLSEVLGYLYRGNAKAFKNDKILNHDELKGIKLKKGCLAMDDYAAMTDKELSEIIEFLCGDKLNALSDDDKLHTVMTADKDSRLRSGLIKKALNLKTSPAKKPAAKKAPKKSQKPKAQPEKITKQKTKPKKAAENSAADKKAELPSKKQKNELPVWLL